MDDDETVTSKEAAFMLDTSMEEDMQSYKKEITLHVIKTINKSPELYKRARATIEQNASLHITCKWYAQEHGDEFGDLFVTELDDVDWDEVRKRV